jgi:hypothetical protein
MTNTIPTVAPTSTARTPKMAAATASLRINMGETRSSGGRKDVTTAMRRRGHHRNPVPPQR